MKNFEGLLEQIKTIEGQSHRAIKRSIDIVLVLRSWLIGASIVQFEQSGEDRAQYGMQLLASLAEALLLKGYSGLGHRNLKNFRQIALTWPHFKIRQTLSAELGIRLNEEALTFPALKNRKMQAVPWQDDAWILHLFSSLSLSHLLELSRVDDPQKRAFYEFECLRSRWSVRELRRQRDSLLYERAALSIDKAEVRKLMGQGGQDLEVRSVIKDPYVLEFLGLEQRSAYSESDLEAALLSHLLNYLADNARYEGEGPPIGIIMCTEKDVAEVHYATSGLSKEVFVSRYLIKLPKEEDLSRWLAEERELLEQTKGTSST